LLSSFAKSGGSAVAVELPLPASFVVTFALHSDKLRYAFFYLSISTLSFSLWALERYERAVTAAI
jgi:hypothetical protein